MILRYRLYLRQEVCERLLALNASDRDRLFVALERIAENPFEEAPATGLDADGNPYQIRVAGSFGLALVVSHADKEIRILDLIEEEGPF